MRRQGWLSALQSSHRPVPPVMATSTSRTSRVPRLPSAAPARMSSSSPCRQGGRAREEVGRVHAHTWRGGRAVLGARQASRALDAWLTQVATPPHPPTHLRAQLDKRARHDAAAWKGWWTGQGRPGRVGRCKPPVQPQLQGCSAARPVPHCQCKAPRPPLHCSLPRARLEGAPGWLPPLTTTLSESERPTTSAGVAASSRRLVLTWTARVDDSGVGSKVS